MIPAPDASAAIILCGGRSVRMGQDKAWLLIDGETFLNRICRIVDPCFDLVVVVAARNQNLPEIPATVQVVRDTMPDAGPLAGLLTGLQEIQRRQPDSEHCWLGSCDTPFVNPSIIQHLQMTLRHQDAVVVQQADRIQPFGGVYRFGIQEIVQQLIDSGERRLNQLAQRICTEFIDAEELRIYDPDLAFLRNFNTPDDYERCRAL